MRPKNPMRLLGTRILSAFIAWTMAFGPVTAAYAAPTALADVPIAAKVSAKPNIIYTLDDSGSMQYNYLPDYVVSTAGQINISIIRQGAAAPFTALATGAVNALNVGDQVNIIGATQPEYNGFVTITGKPSTTQFTYDIPGAPTTPAVLEPGYPSIMVVTSSPYCRAGNGAGTCTPQAMNITSAGTAIAGTNTITRAGPIGVGGLDVATATNTAANFAPLNDGDTVVIEQTAGAGNRPGTSSDPFYGIFTIGKPNATTIFYNITAVAGVTPVIATGAKLIRLPSGSTFAAPPLHAADFNRLAYNPAVTYTAPKKADGTPLTSPGTDANGNYAYNAVQWVTQSVERDPFHAYEVAAGAPPMWPTNPKDNLSRVAVPLYCNTDWPLLVNDPAGPATALDAGDANGQYQATKGAWCRINGTPYDASVASGAPATAVAGVEMGYNYPWQKTSGAEDPKYFYRQLSTKVLWCDSSSPWWPRTSTITGCNGGTPVTVTSGTVQQKCNQQGLVCNPTAA